jgi:general secretion pathway protein I
VISEEEKMKNNRNGKYSNRPVSPFIKGGKEGGFYLHPVPWSLVSGPFAKRAASRQGFTLLEVMIAMAILATVLVTVFHSQSQSIAMANESRTMTTLALLAQSRMAEMEGQQDLSTGQTSGTFGDDYPNYSWSAAITQPPGPGSSYLRKIEIAVVHNYYPKRPYRVILYRPITISKQ